MNTTSQTIAKLHTLVRSLEELRNDVSEALIESNRKDASATREQATLSDLHHRISSAIDALSAEARER